MTHPHHGLLRLRRSLFRERAPSSHRRRLVRRATPSDGRNVVREAQNDSDTENFDPPNSNTLAG
jgi:hypothetical protein